MPSVRAMRLARRSGYGRRAGHSRRFNALGAGDEARESISAASRCRVVSSFNALGAGDKAREADLKELQGLPITTFQCPRCGR